MCIFIKLNLSYSSAHEQQLLQLHWFPLRNTCDDTSFGNQQNNFINSCCLSSPFLSIYYLFCFFSFSYSKLLEQKEQLEQKHLHLLQILDSERQAKWHYVQQTDELTLEVKKLKNEVTSLKLQIVSFHNFGGLWGGVKTQRVFTSPQPRFSKPANVLP